MAGEMSGIGAMLGGFLQMLQLGMETDAERTNLERAQRTAEDNAALASGAAADAVRRGNYQGGLIRLKGTQYGAQMQSAYQGGGVDATVGTPADNAAYISASAEQDAQVAENNAMREAFGFKVQKKRFQSEAGYARSAHGGVEARAAIKASAIGLNTIGSVAGTQGR